MSFATKVLDRIKVTSTSTGTGTMTVSSAVTGFFDFSGFSAEQFYYLIQHQSANEWEIGIGTNSGGVITRVSVLRSSNSNSLVNFSVGTKIILNVIADDLFSDIDTRLVAVEEASVGFVIIGKSTTGAGALEEITVAVDRLIGRDGSGNIDDIQVKTNHIASNQVTYSRLQQPAAGFTVLCKPTTGVGDFTEVAMGTDTVLMRSGSGNIVGGTVVANQISTDAVTTAKIINDAVTWAKIQNASGFTIPAKVDTGSGDLAELAVGTNTVVGRVAGNIVAAQVVTAQIADDNVTFPKIVNSAAGFSIISKVATGAGDFAELVLAADQFIARLGSGNIVGAKITDYTAETSIADGDEILIYDASAAAHRKITRANLFKQPAFATHLQADQSIASSTETLINFSSTPDLDTHSWFSTANKRYTPLLAGNYLITLNATFDNTFPDQHQMAAVIRKNGSQGNLYSPRLWNSSGVGSAFLTCAASCVMNFNGSTDYVDFSAFQSTGSDRSVSGAVNDTFASGIRVSP